MNAQGKLADNESKKIARIVGILFIIGTVAGILSVVLTGPIVNDEEYLVKVNEDEDMIVTGALCILVMGLALALVPVVIYPILKKHNRTLALGYVVFRGALETVTYILMVMAFLLLVVLGRENANVPDASDLKTIGDLLLDGIDLIGAVTSIVFPLGAMMLYYVFYRYRLIPRWLSGWGLVAAILTLVSGLAQMYSSDLGILALPMLPQEMVMAAWLIIKGFKIPTADRQPV